MDSGLYASVKLEEGLYLGKSEGSESEDKSVGVLYGGKSEEGLEEENSEEGL